MHGLWSSVLSGRQRMSRKKYHPRMERSGESRRVAGSTPVAIRHIEQTIADRGFAEGWVEARPPSTASGFRVAVIGSGPAGLAAGQQLRRFGHTVVVFEKDERVGGLLRYGIPDFKLEKSV